LEKERYRITINPKEVYLRNYDYLDLLRVRQGWYEQTGNGPLVAYAGRDKKGRSLVGRVYANFAVIEEDPSTLKFVAAKLKKKIRLPKGNYILCGVQMGGISLSTILSLITGWLVIKAEKKVIKAAIPGKSRENSAMILKRHEIYPGEKVIIVEDICNNFSTTEKLIRLIESFGAEVVAIVCFLNRSKKFAEYYRIPGTDRKIPVFSLIQRELPEYEQDDPEVVQEVKRNNVLWSPKEQWSLALEKMRTGEAIA
jgi:orotate phosphoribosyltransferase